MATDITPETTAQLIAEAEEALRDAEGELIFVMVRNLVAHLAHYQAQAEALRETFAAGYHCQWDRDCNCYIFDPQLKPGDPDGAFEAWSRHTKT